MEGAMAPLKRLGRAFAGRLLYRGKVAFTLDLLGTAGGGGSREDRRRAAGEVESIEPSGAFLYGASSRVS
jgi:hypothetical protein